MKRSALIKAGAFLSVSVFALAGIPAQDTNRLRQLETNIARYTETLRTNPRNVAAYVNRGSAWAEKKEYDKAIDDFNRAQRLDPKNPVIYYNRGNAWSNRSDYTNAIKDYTEALGLDPKDGASFCNRGIAWFEKQEYQRAIDDFSKAVVLDPKDAVAYYNRGNVWLRKRDYEKAIVDYSKSIELEPRYSEAYINRGVCFRRKKEYGKAIADYRSATEIAPDNDVPYQNRAWLWATCPDERFRDGKRAVESATRACEITRWRDAGELDTLAAAYAEAGDFAKAVEWQEKANRLYTDVEDRKEGEERLRLYKKREPYREEG